MGKLKIYEQVARLHSQGLEVRQIAARLGRTTKSVYGATNLARQKQLLPEFRPTKTGFLTAKRRCLIQGITIGRMRELMQQLQPDVISWIIDHCPKGATVAEFIGSIIIDVYHEETQEDSTCTRVFQKPPAGKYRQVSKKRCWKKRDRKQSTRPNLQNAARSRSSQLSHQKRNKSCACGTNWR